MSFIDLIPAAYQPYVISVLGVIVAITHGMALLGPTAQKNAGIITSILNVIAGNYLSAANASANVTSDHNKAGA
jgi:hypothetical protein